LFLAVLLASTLAIAQGTTTANLSQDGQNPPTPPVTGQDSSQTGQTATVQGCLSSSSLADNTFTLTQDQTGTVYTLTGNTTHLQSHVGHEVAARGLVVSNASNASSSNLPASSDPSRAVPNLTGTSTPNHTTENTLQVSGAEMVSDHCVETGTTPPSGAATSRDDFRPATSENSPQPTTVLPLLGLLGLGSLIAGLIVRR
jgi:hypothetical protein